MAGAGQMRGYNRAGMIAIVVLVIGASRLYLGVHWLTDVLGGYALGLGWLSLVMVMALLLEDRRQR